jgi:Kef-type K+ transport system membrane component KefB
MEFNLFVQLSTLLAITVSVAFLVRLLKQPLIVAYILAGIIGGPFFLNLMHAGEHMYDAFASFGVVLLLFIIGLDLNFSYLKKIGKEAAIIGILQFIFNFGMFLPLALYFGFTFSSAFFLALAACFSSTIVVMKILSDKKDEESVYGRYTIGLMLVQDILSILVLLWLSFNMPNSAVNSFSLWSTLQIILVFGLIIFFAKFILPKFLNRISSSGEFLFIFTVTWCFSVASLLYWAGFSLELGAIVAGLSLGSSKYQAEIRSRIKPLRDFFLVLFFILLGSQADFSQAEEVLKPALILSAFVLIAQPTILYFLFRFRRFTRRNSFLGALTSGQLSEFGFIILFAGTASGYIEGREMAIFTAAAIITIFFSSYMMTYSYQLYNWALPFFLYFGKDKFIQSEELKEKFSAIIFGYHRTGWKIGSALEKQGIDFATVDFNPELIEKNKKKGIKSFYGDASDIEFLRELPMQDAKYIISTIPSAEDQVLLINFVRQVNPKAILIASLYHKKYLEALYEAGADYVILPHLLGGSWAAEIIAKGELGKKVSWKKYKAQQHRDLHGS